MNTMRIFLCGDKAVVTEEISHWWIAEDALNGPALCLSMRNGKQINLDRTDAPCGSDGHGIKKGLLDFLERAWN